MLSIFQTFNGRLIKSIRECGYSFNAVLMENLLVPKKSNRIHNEC